MSRRGNRIAGLVLAAGASRRMGTAKQLLTLDGKTLVAHVLGEALASRLDRIFLVLGHEADRIRGTLGEMAHHPKLSIVANPFYEAGISTSILAGLGQAEEAHDHVMILLGDMPGIRTAVIDRLIESYLASGRPLGAVCVKGRRSHPVIFGRSLYPDLRALKGDTGARPVFAAHADDACLLDLDYDDRDIDTPKDYEIR